MSEGAYSDLVQAGGKNSQQHGEDYFERSIRPLLLMEDIDKAFPGVQALKGAGLTVHAGEVVALMGENGAGKSTLVKCLVGIHQPDSGIVRYLGRRTRFDSPLKAIQAGIAVIYQEFNLVPELSVRENLFLGQEQARFWIDRAAEHGKALQVLQRLEADIDPEARVGRLSVAQQQAVEIAKALLLEAKVIFMDEPTAALSPREVDRLLEVIRDLRDEGLGIVYISHRLEEIFRIADAVTVLRDGELVGVRSTSQITRPELIELMVGRKVEAEFPRRDKEGDAEDPDASGPDEAKRTPLLEVRGLSAGKRVKDVSFSLYPGEILGLSGLVGAGRTDLARLIFGADPADSGQILLRGKPLPLRSPVQAIENGICLLNEDRKSQGLFLEHAVQANFAIASLAKFASLGWVRDGSIRRALQRYVERFRIRMPGVQAPIKNLSGGNQQKVLLARWLETHSEVVLFDEPTRGIDVGAKYDIYVLVNELASQGKGVLFISSEFPEVLGMCDRILVMHEGRLKGEVSDVANATQEDLLAMAVS
ncbi:MAG TPA: sugar ABC transporter ATP-binding protein [Acidobacteriota bacterium]|nr:sugar ABC transporter ATP-binding protein [Acidobacteriota bacterium]